MYLKSNQEKQQNSNKNTFEYEVVNVSSDML